MTPSTQNDPIVKLIDRIDDITEKELRDDDKHRTQNELYQKFADILKNWGYDPGEHNHFEIDEMVDVFLAALQSQQDRILQMVEEIDKDHFIEAKDNDSHRYKIPLSKRAEWQAFCEIPEDDERSWDVPEWAQRIDGEPIDNSVAPILRLKLAQIKEALK